jgi:hypothetical protein
LALAVVAQAPRLEHAVSAKRVERVGEIGVTVHSEVAGCGYAGVVEEGFFRQPVLGDLQRLGRRQHVKPLGQRSRGRDGHVLEFVSHDVGAVGERGEGGRVVIGADDLA